MGAARELMEPLGWHARSTRVPSGYASRALTPEASLDLGSNFIELRFWEIRRPRLGRVA
jgi:hypothetical protein